MNRRNLLLLMAVLLMAARCATTTPPPPMVTPEGEDRFVIDPRTGFEGTVTPQTAQNFENAWRYLLAGNYTEAHRRLAEIAAKDPQYLPATLAEAAIDIREGRLDVARDTVAQIVRNNPTYTAARVYEAEIALRGNDARRAYDIYNALATQPNAPPTAAERVAELRTRLFQDVFTQAQTATGPASTELLREALELDPASSSARVLLVQRLVAQKDFDAARRELDPLLATTRVDQPEVQEALAEIDAGRGRYQEAIVRYDRLARRTKDPRYNQRLDEIKERWSAANMPTQYQAALESEAITRADFAVLLYWIVPNIRFAQNLATPPIATDVADVAGREEVIRAMAIGLYDVDPVTRRVSPMRPVTTTSLQRLIPRLLSLRGAACARGVPQDQIVSACGIQLPQGADLPVSGATAKALLESLGKVF
ncbi:MAG TPA: tetratricopeptide repeat protein [Thermoanaerobaculia bacterium]|nr:tetratricopeptide repeat protein [Thermoanaerobaculia bacterium]